MNPLGVESRRLKDDALHGEMKMKKKGIYRQMKEAVRMSKKRKTEELRKEIESLKNRLEELETKLQKLEES